MLRGLYSAARGMAVQVKKQEVGSNNLANGNTVGFKKDLVLVQSFSEQLLSVSANKREQIGEFSQSPVIESIATSFAPGLYEYTERSLDLAISGDAFFVVETPEGRRYTKDGSFSLDEEGFLVTSDGNFVLSVDDQRIQLQNDKVKIDENGAVWTAGEESNQFADRLALAEFNEEGLEGLEKRGQNLFEAVDVMPVGRGQGQVKQGVLENANLEIIREMVDMISVMRVYEANQKSLQAHDEMLGKSVNDVGRIR